MSGKLNTAALAWAMSIPCKPELRGALLTFCGRADADSIMRRDMRTLCYELASDDSTIRRLMSHMEKLGLITRLTGKGGPTSQQVVQIHTERSAADLLEGVLANPYHHPRNSRDVARVGEDDNPRDVAWVTENQPVPQTRAISPGLNVTRATNHRDVARVDSESTAHSKDARAPASLTPVVPELTSPSPVKTSSVEVENVPISAEIGGRLKIVDSNFSRPGVPDEIPPDKPKKPNAVGMVLDEFDRCGMERPVMTGQDTAAIKAAFNSGRPWLPLAVIIVDCYGSVQRREWPPGDTWLANNLSLHTVIGRVAAYEAWIKQGKPTPPQPRNGRFGRPAPSGDVTDAELKSWADKEIRVGASPK